MLKNLHKYSYIFLTRLLRENQDEITG